jgi:hypothetical protein
MHPEWLPKNAVVCPGHISFFYFEDDRKRCTYTREALVNVTSNFFLFYITLGGANAIAWFLISVLKLGDIFNRYLTKSI